MPLHETYAPGHPGIEPRWATAAKEGVGAAFGPDSLVTFALSHGILNEIYYPRVDSACTRDMGFLVASGTDYFSEEKRHATSKARLLEAGIPAYHLVNTSNDGRYVIEKRIIADPWRDVVLQKIKFKAGTGKRKDYHLYALLAPHMANRGWGNTAWLADYKGTPVLLAERDGVALAMAASAPWLHRSAGFVGTSDGWQDLSAHKQMEWEYERAENGNVALTGEIDLESCKGEFVLAIGFGGSPNEAALRAITSLQAGFDRALDVYVKQWRAWYRQFARSHASVAKRRESKISNAVLHLHTDKRSHGGIIASLSVPWGQSKSDDDLGGYHLVWIRDMVEAATGLLASGAHGDAQLILDYLSAVQEPDGRWSQNMWLDGSPFWTGIQMDEVAFPILFLDLARREGAISPDHAQSYHEMVRKAAGFLVRNGPVTQQDRWEEDAGFSPFTLAVEIAGLLAAADVLDELHDSAAARYLRETADCWNSCIERWCYAEDTDLARQVGVNGYYVRILPPQSGDAASPMQGFVPIKNRAPGDSEFPASQIVSTDPLALVRFGLRTADDPRIVSTVKVIDHLLKVETPSGPVWHRYTDDGYGEHEDGSDFDGTGVGRAWPLLTGERAHYEVDAGHLDEARRLLTTMESLSSDTGFIPEQVWDRDDIPGRELFLGRPSGSAMPLVWAHAEHIKLVRSVQDGKVFDKPPQPLKRYAGRVPDVRFAEWRFNQKIRALPEGKDLRLSLLAPAVIHWSTDRWRTFSEINTVSLSLDIHYADLPVRSLSAGTIISFTLYWTGAGRWEGTNFEVEVADSTKGAK
jgi:glucoamylase